MFNLKYNHVIGVSALLGIFSYYTLSSSRNSNDKKKIINIEKNDKIEEKFICYSNCENNNYSDNFSEYDDSSDSDSSDNFNLKSYALTEYEYC